MKKILLFAAALLTLTAVNAKVWLINYNDNAQADFKTIADAVKYKDFQNGDVLYVEPISLQLHSSKVVNARSDKTYTITINN